MLLIGMCCTQGITATWDEMVGKSEMDNGGSKQDFKYGNYRNGILLIPDSTNDTVGMFNPYDGTYLGDILAVPLIHGTISTPLNAILGPDGNIYVSDQVQDAIFVFNSTGIFLYEYANDTDGLNNIRGIAFRGTHLFVTSGDDYVAEFDGPHSRLPDFINDGSDPFDIFFLDDDRALLSDIQGSTDNVRLYYANGTLDTVLFQVNFPQQIMNDTILPGSYLNAGFSENQITDFDLDGTIIQTTPFSSGRGIYRLGNGNLLATDADGVWEITPGAGTIIDHKKGGSARFIEFYGPTQEEYSLTIIIEGNGTVTKNPDQTTYPYGTLVQLTAVPDTNWTFSHWSGDLTGDNNPEILNMTGNKTITAHFIPEAITLNIDLYPGWNLITVPCENTLSAETLGQNINGCNLVLRFNASTQGFETYVMGSGYDNFPIQDGVGYFVRVPSNTVFNCTGMPISSVNVTVYESWNTLGWFHDYLSSARSLAGNTSASLVLMFNATTQDFMTYVWPSSYDNFIITRGMGVFIRTSTQSYWHGEG
jgi:hypothetical protein